MSRYKGIIFDLDGTLLDTLDDLSNSVNEALKSFDFPTHKKESYKKKIGRGFRDLICKSMPAETKENIVDEGLQIFLQHYEKSYMNETKPYGGITNVLEMLQNRGVKIAVNSNKRNDYTVALIKKNFPKIDFIDCFGEREGIPKKPDPTSALELRNLMALKSNEIIYVGDSKTDILTAKNANMDSIGVLWGFRDEVELTAHQATYIARTPKDIEAIILGND